VVVGQNQVSKRLVGEPARGFRDGQFRHLVADRRIESHQMIPHFDHQGVVAAAGDFPLKDDAEQ
jgi:hypothetical protein